MLPACYDDWVLVQRDRFRQLRLHALEALCERLTASGRYGEAIDAGLAAVCAEPLRESSHRVLIRRTWPRVTTLRRAASTSCTAR